MKVLLDAGHYALYNNSPCRTNPQYWESIMNWNLHLKIKARLEAMGVSVGITRQDRDTDMGVYARGLMAKGYDLMVSIHSNATGNSQPNEAIDYPLAYCQISGAADEIGLALAIGVQKTMGTKQEGRITHRANEDGEDWYGVLRGAEDAGTVALILEHSFHTNTRSTEWLLKDENLDALADSDATIIYSWLQGREEKEGQSQVIAKPDCAYRTEKCFWGIVEGLEDGDYLNVRTEPNRNAPLVKEWAHLGEGNGVTVRGQNLKGTWLYVTIANKWDGWVSAEYIRKTDVVQEITGPNKKENYVGTVVNVPKGDVLNVRVKASGNGDILVAWPALGNGNKVAVKGSTNSWLFVDIQGTKGWVASAYILRT